MSHPPLVRSRPGTDGQDAATDRCPGVARPWPAEDGLLVRVRLPGGRVTAGALASLSGVAREHGDGDLHLTGRANLQLRALPSADAADGGPGAVRPDVVADLAATGLLPSTTHELVRNLMASPRTGLDTGRVGGGRADLRPVVHALDAALLAEPAAAGLSGRFLLALDDGRGDLVDRPCDLGAVALDDRTAQLRVGAGWGEVVALDDVPAALLDLVRRFLAARPDPAAAWHVAELDGPLAPTRAPDDRVPAPAARPAYGPLVGGEHVEAPGGVLGPDLVDALVARDPGGTLVVTPWRGVVVPDPAPHEEGGAR
ncbi:nitrite reductase [Nocardioides sp. AX2bis]|uniref:nitrite reductase n=1 Tax=Nocardioides sp. AX2bis TaxID=2653157 RepID=UPI0012F37D81|nr:nitrite reductase [Nocardioides sp. AX2bis]VXC50809.1 Precorrin-3B synthase [Nocardioides sp. AX2bis]